jgi:hypothetical protein
MIKLTLGSGKEWTGAMWIEIGPYFPTQPHPTLFSCFSNNMNWTTQRERETVEARKQE